MTMTDPFTFNDVADDAEAILSQAAADDVDDQGDDADPAAPYGINPNTGRPYTKSAEERQRWGKAMAEARANKGPRVSGRGAPAKTRRSAGAPGGSSRPNKSTARLQAAQALMQLPAVLTAMLGTVMPAFRYDSMAFSLHGEAVAVALADTAETVPAVAALLERAGKVGPYGALVTAMTPLVVQLAANHNMIRPGMMGTLDRENLFATVAPDAYAQARAAQQARDDALPDAA